jgi:hypothetical protein
MWTTNSLPRGMCGTHLSDLLVLCGAHICWHGSMNGCHVYSLWWCGLIACCHMVMWRPEVLPCHLYFVDMCRIVPIASWHVSLSDDMPADVGRWVSATWHVWGPPVIYPCWHGPIGLWHVAVACWPGPLWCCHVAHLLSSYVLYPLCFLHPICTQSCCYPQVVPRVSLIKSQPLINPFNLFHLLWIYFNSSAYPKNMKFSPKISQFMMITPVIFNSIFAPASLN